jgi:glucokinase
MVTRQPDSFISLDLGGTKIYGMLNDAAGTVLAEQTWPTFTNGSADAYEQLLRLISLLLAEAQRLGRAVRGIGLGVPGMTDQGQVIAAPALGWLDEPVSQHLQARFGLLSVVENDVNLAALGEYGFGAAQNARSLICVAIGTGIGSGIVLGGQLYRGAHFSAGEIGYMVVDPAQADATFSNADFGAFEQLASGTGLVARARRMQPVGIDTENLTGEFIVTAAARGDAWAQQAVDETVRLLAQGLTNVIAVLDPEVIVLSGGVMQKLELFLEPIITHIQRLIPFHPRIVASALGPRATALGATVLLAEAAARTGDQ